MEAEEEGTLTEKSQRNKVKSYPKNKENEQGKKKKKKKENVEAKEGSLTQ